MRRFVLSSALITTMGLLSACGGNPEDNKVTETRMDDLDSLEGTISDDMINTDESTDEAPLESASPEDGAKPKVPGNNKVPGDDKIEKKEEPKSDALTEDKAAAE